MTSSPWAKWLLAWVPVIGFVATGVTLSTQAPEPATYAGDGTRVAAAVTAAREGLPYLPGEVLVQFKSGTAVTQMAGALRVLRSRPVTVPLRSPHWWALGVLALAFTVVRNLPSGAALAP